MQREWHASCLSRFDKELARAVAASMPASLLMIDVDRLKEINTRCGRDLAARYGPERTMMPHETGPLFKAANAGHIVGAH